MLAGAAAIVAHVFEFTTSLMLLFSYIAHERTITKCLEAFKSGNDDEQNGLRKIPGTK